MAAWDDIYYPSPDGLALHYRHYSRRGPGLPLICLHGITRNARDFEELGERLAPSRDVLAVDFRGRGESAHDPDWRNYQPATYVDDVLQLLEQAGIPRAIFLGTSLGGLVSMLLAATAPARVAGVILNDIGPEIAPAGLERIREYIGRLPPVASWDEAIAQTREIYAPAWPDLPDDAWPGLARRHYREDENGVPHIDMDPAVGEAARKLGATLEDPWQLFAALRPIPTLLVHGALSDILDDNIVARMQDAKPDMRYLRIANRGHVPLLDEIECMAVMNQFLVAVDEKQ